MGTEAAAAVEDARAIRSRALIGADAQRDRVHLRRHRVATTSRSRAPPASPSARQRAGASSPWRPSTNACSRACAVWARRASRSCSCRCAATVCSISICWRAALDERPTTAGLRHGGEQRDRGGAAAGRDRRARRAGGVAVPHRRRAGGRQDPARRRGHEGRSAQHLRPQDLRAQGQSARSMCAAGRACGWSRCSPAAARSAALRSGTLPAPLIVGLGEACAIAGAEMADEATRLAAAARPPADRGLHEGDPGARAQRRARCSGLPGNLNLDLPGRRRPGADGGACRSSRCRPDRPAPRPRSSRPMCCARWGCRTSWPTARCASASDALPRRPISTTPSTAWRAPSGACAARPHRLDGTPRRVERMPAFRGAERVERCRR